MSCNELAVYIHIPFCVRKCAYCDFLSFPASEEVRGEYLNKLEWEIKMRAEALSGYRVSSVFFGGGTPSVLPADAPGRLLAALRENLAFLPESEISIEANPGTVTREKAEAWKEAGINRLSMGCQSLKDEELALLGRIHQAEDSFRSFETARAAGFSNINVDLMSALPGQSVASCLDSLREVLHLGPEHLSAYSLIVEEGTPFYEAYGRADELRRRGKEQKLLPTEEEEREMLYEGRRILTEAGFVQYEISNYARDGHVCRHNLCYWKRGDYAGFGLGAVGCMGEVRRKNTEDLKRYLEAEKVEELCGEEEHLTLEDARAEAMFLGLRLCEGVDPLLYEKRYGKKPEELYGEWIGKMLAEGLLVRESGRLKLSMQGQDLANVVMGGFV
ncbi:MAG: radical SAM family heme chaperone HemW [Lachnospiraceae bacterium]|nr:radical SAM family heme chaperone HemW [Lachnospiraceae bacterium]